MSATQAQQRDARFERLVAEHFAFIWRLLRRLGLQEPDADDAAQQVFMIAMPKIDSIAPGRERSFLYGTALRVCANARRGKQRRKEVGDQDFDARSSAELGPDAQVELVRARALLDELLERLPDELRRVLVLAEIEQLEVPEIAALEQIPVGTAASRLRRARETFRAQLSKVQARNPFREPEP